MKQVKNLGFIFDDTLCLEPQINQVMKTCYYRLCNLYRIGNMLDKDRKLQLVTLYIFSCLESCNILYYGLSKKLLTKLQVLLMTVFILCMLSTGIVGEKVYLPLNLLWNYIFYLFIFVFYINFTDCIQMYIYMVSGTTRNYQKGMAIKVKKLFLDIQFLQS